MGGILVRPQWVNNSSLIDRNEWFCGVNMQKSVVAALKFQSIKKLILASL